MLGQLPPYRVPLLGQTIKWVVLSELDTNPGPNKEVWGEEQTWGVCGIYNDDDGLSQTKAQWVVVLIMENVQRSSV